jgi:hypothetical protein
MNFGKIEIGIGAVIIVLGTVFALQGAGIIGGSSLMDNNSTFVLVGPLIAVGGLVLVAFGLQSPGPKPKKEPPSEIPPV